MYMNIKKFLSILITASMVLQTGVFVFAEENTEIATETPSVTEVTTATEADVAEEELPEESSAVDTSEEAEPVVETIVEEAESAVEANSEANIEMMSFDGITTIASDTTSDWVMQWSWERFEAGWDYYADWTLTNGFEITYNKTKYDELNAVAYPTLDEGETQSTASGEYKMAFKTDADGKAVAFGSAAAVNTNLWFHQGRDNVISNFDVTGDNASDTRPLIVSFKYKFDTTNDQFWNMPKITIAGITFYVSRTKIGVNSASSLVDVTNETYEHDAVIRFVPENGKLKLTHVNIDGKDCTPATAVVTSAGKITNLSILAYRASANVTHFIKDLNIVRGEDSISLSSDYVSGSEITSDGVTVTSNIDMASDALKDKVTVYDADFNEIAAGYTLDVTYGNDRKSAVINVTGLEAGGNYRLMIDSISDRLGTSCSTPFDIDFKTAPPDEEEEEEPDDTPTNTPDESVIGGDGISINSNSDYHGVQFTTVSKEDGVYTTKINTDKWYAAETIREAENGVFMYVDENGVKKKLGYGNDNWNKVVTNISVEGDRNDGNMIVVSFKYKADNFHPNYEWATPYFTVMGTNLYFADISATKAYIKYNDSKANTYYKSIEIGAPVDGYHEVKLMVMPYVSDNGSYIIHAIEYNGKLNIFSDAHSMSREHTDEDCVVSNIRMNYGPVGNNGKEQSFLKDVTATIEMKDLEVTRVSTIEAELFNPTGVLLPEDDIKLNFNYQLPHEFTEEDFTIYEITQGEDGEIKTPIQNPITVSKEYDGKQIKISVGGGGLYYGKDYRVEVNKDIIVNDYIPLVKKSYDIPMMDNPPILTVAEEKTASNKIKYSISGDDVDSYFLVAVSYDANNKMVGIKNVTAQKQGSGTRQKAKGELEIANPQEAQRVEFFIFDSEQSLGLYRLPTVYNME